MLQTISLPNTLSAWQNQAEAPILKQALTEELNQFDKTQLPLQSGLTQGSWVVDQPIQLMILDQQSTTQTLTIKALVFYSSLNAGSCCENDPSPNCELTETITVLLQISRQDALTQVRLLRD